MRLFWTTPLIITWLFAFPVRWKTSKNEWNFWRHHVHLWSSKCVAYNTSCTIEKAEVAFAFCCLGCVFCFAPQNKTFWNRNWSILREVLYWRLRCVIDQDPTPDCHTRKMLKNLEWMGLGSISQNNQINKYQLLASFSKEQKAASCCVLEGNHHAKTDNPAICGHQQQAIADSPLGCGITIPPAR